MGLIWHNTLIDHWILNKITSILLNLLETFIFKENNFILTDLVFYFHFVYDFHIFLWVFSMNYETIVRFKITEDKTHSVADDTGEEQLGSPGWPLPPRHTLIRGWGCAVTAHCSPTEAVDWDRGLRAVLTVGWQANFCLHSGEDCVRRWPVPLSWYTS